MPRVSQVPETDYGEPVKYDPNFNGPIHRRSCTDILCLMIFLVFLVCWGCISAYAILHGDVRRLLVPTDSNGLKCGLDSPVIDKPYLVFFDMTKCLSPTVPINGCPTTQVCVKSCPTMTMNPLYVPNEDINLLKENLVCKYDFDKNKIRTVDDLKNSMNDNQCAKFVFESNSILGRCFGDLTPYFCGSGASENQQKSSDSNILKKISGGFSNIFSSNNKPNDKNTEISCDRNAMKKVKDLERLKSRTTVLDTYIGLIIANWMWHFSDDKSVQEMSTMIIEDLVNIRWYLVVALVIVMLVCLIYIALMRWVAAPMVWFSIFGVMGILSYCIYLSYIRYAYLKEHPVILQESQTNLSAIVKSFINLKETWLAILIITSVVLLIILLALIFLRKRIVIAIALIKEGSKAVSSVMSTLLFPIFPWIMQCLVLALTIVVALYLSSIGESNYKAVIPNNTECSSGCSYKNGDPCIPDTFNSQCHPVCKDAVCHFVSVTNPTYINALLAVDIVGFFWGIFFLQGLGEMILASVFATWYWTYKKSDVPFFTLTSSIARTCTYHLGTIAFGSLIITICRLIRLALEYIDSKVKNYDNFLTRAIMCCCKCFFACLESFLRFINKNAYIMCAIHGKGFCPSARDAFSLLMRNIVRVFVLDRVTDFLFFLSKVVVAAGCGIAAYFAFTSPEVYKVTGNEQQILHYDLVPPIIVGVAAYIIASVFFSVYSMAVDTLFLCFLEDCERNDGSPEKPYFMSKQLMKILGKRNKIQ